MNAFEQFVLNIYEISPDNVDLAYDSLKMAARHIKQLKALGYDVPEGLTAKDLMEIWNGFVTARFKYPQVPSGRNVARYALMTESQIANAIIKANGDWNSVYDLVIHVMVDILHIQTNENGIFPDWEAAVTNWCNSQK